VLESKASAISRSSVFLYTQLFIRPGSELTDPLKRGSGERKPFSDAPNLLSLSGFLSPFLRVSSKTEQFQRSLRLSALVLGRRTDRNPWSSSPSCAFFDAMTRELLL